MRGQDGVFGCLALSPKKSQCMGGLEPRPRGRVMSLGQSCRERSKPRSTRSMVACTTHLSFCVAVLVQPKPRPPAQQPTSHPQRLGEFRLTCLQGVSAERGEAPTYASRWPPLGWRQGQHSHGHLVVQGCSLPMVQPKQGGGGGWNTTRKP